MARKTSRSSISKTGMGLESHSAKSNADAPLTVSTPTGKARRILYATVKYSANVTENVTVIRNSQLGSDYDTLRATLVLTAERDGFFAPSEELNLLDGDALDVLAPAGGPGITSAIEIVSEVL